jgi:glycosyltransferase involved in cell wall biosynthesis
VLLVAYHDAILHLPAVFDLPSLAREYALVLEPSTWGYDDARFLLYLGSDVAALVEAQSRPDFDLLRAAGTNLVPVSLGAGDWADPGTFAPKAGPRAYDVAMVSAWDPLKRHDVLLRALARLRDERARPLRAVLVGYPMRWTRERVERAVARHGLEAQVTVLDSVPHAEVARVLADSKVSVLLSRREGANRAVYESLFCDTPVVVPRGHRGVNLDHVVPETGRLATDDDLADVLLSLVDDRSGLAPRAWALRNTGWPVATRRLEEALASLARERGLPWTRGLVAKRNAPGLRYARAEDRVAMEPEYERLARHLLPV